MEPWVTRGGLLAACLMVALPTCTCAQSERGGTPKYAFRVRLSDGSTLVGEPSLTRFPVRTDFATLQAELRHIRAIARDSEGRASVTFVNGDRLQGDVDVPSFDLATALGNVTVPMALWMDDLRFYSRALSETEVRELYGAGE